MGKELWRDNVDKGFYLEERGCYTLAFESDTVDMGGTGYLLNDDIPALVGALAKHLYKCGKEELLVEAVTEALKQASPRQTVEAWRNAITGEHKGVDGLVRFTMQHTIETVFSRE